MAVDRTRKTGERIKVFKWIDLYGTNLRACVRVRVAYVRMCIFVSVIIIDYNLYMYLYICMCKRMFMGVPLFVRE